MKGVIFFFLKIITYPPQTKLRSLGGGGLYRNYHDLCLCKIRVWFISFLQIIFKKFVLQKDCLWSEGLVWSWPKVLRARSRSLAKKCKFYVRSKSLFGEIFEVLTMLLHTKFDYYLRVCHNIDPSHSCNIKVTGRKKATFVSGPYFFIEKHWKILF